MCNYPAFSGGELLMATGYRPPDKSIPDNKWLNFLSQFHDRFLVAGDFSAHHPLWGSPYACTEGNKLFSAIENKDICVINLPQNQLQTPR
jgi:hypothetical protein